MQHECQRLPVTALAILKNDVFLAGEGLHLAAYELDGTQLRKLKIFERQAIHGIIVSDDRKLLFAWGGQLMRRVDLEYIGNEFELTPGNTTSVKDWILDAAFAPSSSENSFLVAVVTAHNSLVVARKTLSTNDVTFEPVVPGSNCILYSAQVQWQDAKQCLVVSGTAFGDVIIWSASVDFSEGSVQCVGQTKVHYNFSAHEGSIFGVQLSPSLAFPGLDHNQVLLATCSDDRTIRLWDVTDLTTQAQNGVHTERTTGFGEGRNFGQEGPILVAKAMGHLSRIWTVRFTDICGGSRHSIQSFGEDASVITWSIEIDESASRDTLFRLVQVQSDTAHSGKNIWSAALDPGLKLCLTGGVDGAIAKRRQALQGQIRRIEPPSLSEHSVEAADPYRSYCFAGKKRLVYTTNLGRIGYIDIDQDDKITTTINSSTVYALRGYSVVTAANGLTFFAGQHGSIFVQSTSNCMDGLTQLIGLRSKVAGLFACHIGSHTDGYTGLLVTSVGVLTAQLFLFSRDLQGTDSTTTIHLHVGLELPRAFIVTSSTCIRHCDDLYISLGSRTGSLATYRISIPASGVLQIGPKIEPPAITAVHPISIAHEIHGREAVTSLSYQLGTHGKCWIWSTGRDGTIAVHGIKLASEANLRIDLQHQLSLPFGPNVEGLELSTATGLRIHGFKGKRFVVHDLIRQQEVFSVECGGAHRNWAFSPAIGGGTFFWTKASVLFKQTQDKPVFEIVNGGGHGREIKSMAVSEGSSGEQLIASGAEDTNIKIWLYKRGTFKCLHTLRKHNTGIQHLQWVDIELPNDLQEKGVLGDNSIDDRNHHCVHGHARHSNSYLFSSGGFEELFVWRITTGVPRLDIGVVCESIHPRSGTSDLRIMAFHATRTRASRRNPESPPEFTVFTVYSDSIAKFWRYSSTSERRWDLLATGDYLTACLTQAHSLSGAGEEAVNDTEQYITTATDGHLTFWERNATALTWTHRHKVHQNSIHALAELKISEVLRVVVTAGDDNALGISFLDSTSTSPDDFSGRRTPQVQTLLIPRAHAAAVTAATLRILEKPESKSDPDSGVTKTEHNSKGSIEVVMNISLAAQNGHALKFDIISASLDQRVKIWRVRIQSVVSGDKNTSTIHSDRNSEQTRNSTTDARLGSAADSDETVNAVANHGAEAETETPVHHGAYDSAPRTRVRVDRMCSVASAVADISSLAFVNLPRDAENENEAEVQSDVGRVPTAQEAESDLADVDVCECDCYLSRSAISADADADAGAERHGCECSHGYGCGHGGSGERKSRRLGVVVAGVGLEAWRLMS